MRRVSGEERKVLEALFADEDALEAAVLSISNRAPDDIGDSDGEGPLLKLLSWLVNNWESVFKVITSIVGMFGGGLMSVQDEGEFAA